VFDWEIYGYNMERLDFGAYDKDPWYKQGFEGLGRSGGFSTLQDIYDAEQWHKDGMSDSQRAEQAAWEKERDDSLRRNELLQEQLANAQQPRHIDVGQGQSIAEGDVGSYISNLQSSWDQQAAANLDYFSNQLTQQQTDYSNQLAGLQDVWGVQSAQELQDLETSLQSGFNTSLATQDALYNSQIKDLTSSWGLERDQLSGQIGSLGNQLSANQSAYDTSLSNLNEQMALNQSIYNTSLGDLQGTIASNQSAYDTSLGNLQSTMSANQSAYDSKLGNLQNTMSANQSAYDTSLGNLQSTMSANQSAYDTSLGNLQSTMSANQSAYDTSLGNLNTRIDEYKAEQKVSQEAQALEAQRLRTAASYGSSGQPINQSVKGVKTLNELTRPKRSWGGTSGAFGRKGQRITNLNI
jgi:hypothetical protein